MPSKVKEADMTTLLVHLILRNNSGEILLALRGDTKNYPNMHSLPGGHVDPDDDSPRSAAIREAAEELGIHVRAEDITQVVSGNRLEDGREFIDHYFLCSSWEGEITNLEPNKCQSLRFTAPGEIPTSTIGFVQIGLRSFLEGYQNYKMEK